MQVRLQAKALSSDADGDFMVDFAKTFRTMSQDRRAAWLREAALAASAAEPDEADAQQAADAAKQKSSAEATAARIATDVAGIAYRAARKKVAARAPSAAPAVGIRPPTLAAAAPLGLVAGGAVAFAIRHRRKAAQQKPATPTYKSVANGKPRRPWSRPAPTYSPRWTRPSLRPRCASGSDDKQCSKVLAGRRRFREKAKVTEASSYSDGDGGKRTHQSHASMSRSAKARTSPLP